MALARITLTAGVVLAAVLIFLPRDRAGRATAPVSAVKTSPATPAKRNLSSNPSIGDSKPPARETRPSSQEAALADLTRSSVGRWQVTWGAHTVTRLYGARLPLRGRPAEAGGEFLARYGSLIGISPNEARLEQIRTIDGNTQVIYSQELDGLPVFGSRVSVVLDAENNLIYLSSLVYGGAAGNPGAVPAHIAARAAVDGLGDYSRRRLLVDPGISLEEMQARARLGYRLVGNAIGLVYEFSVASHVPPLDLEIYVDGLSGELADIRSLLKNK